MLGHEGDLATGSGAVVRADAPQVEASHLARPAFFFHPSHHALCAAQEHHLRGRPTEPLR